MSDKMACGENNMAAFARLLGYPFDALHLIQDNAYCDIYQASVGNQPYIIKSYYGNDFSLMVSEAEAIDFYHKIANSHPDLIDSRTLAKDDSNNLICIQYVPGMRMSDLIYLGRRNMAVRQKAIRLMTILGTLLKSFYERTVSPGTETADFLFEYLTYCSDRLNQLPILKHTLFRGYHESGLHLIDEFRTSDVSPSFAHGDLVFRNIHIEDEKVGLIDFANTNFKSHILNDVYNIWFALANMILPIDYKHLLIEGLQGGLDHLDFPLIAHRFYYEYHRRRWLMLKLSTKHPRDFLQGIRGILSFARVTTPGLWSV